MEAKDCQVGTRVALVSKTQPCLKGVIKSQVEKHKTHDTIIVEWDGGALQKVTLRSIITEAEGKLQDKQIKDEQDRLEQEFDKVQDTIRLKIRLAAASIKEAAALANKAGTDLRDMYEDVGPLMDALDDAGWNPSSFSC
jgi:hypothetical protein